MKIELKQVHFSERLSEETYAFTADLYIDGKKAGTVSNDGRGGNTNIQQDSAEGGELIRKAAEFCKGLPPVQADWGEYEMDLEDYVDKQLESWLKQRDLKKFEKKMQRAMATNIVLGGTEPDGFGTLRLQLPMDAILKHPDGKRYLIGFIQKNALPYIEKGEKILNTNIPEAILKEAGLKADQYVSPVETKAEATRKPRPKL